MPLALSHPPPDPQAADQARLKAREQVLAMLSHEMRTPLNGVLGMAGLLASTRLDATQQNYLAALRDCGEHLLSLVNDMLDLAKLDSGRVELEPVDTDVERLLQGVCELLSPRAHASGIEIAWAVGRDVPTIRADDGRLRQILFNLAGNAVKLTDRGGVLASAERIEAQAGRVHLRFVVKDTGPGVPTEAQARIFEQFVQTEAGIRAGGAGLGLAIVTRLAEAFDGQVGVESEPGAGARFWFTAWFDALERDEEGDELCGLTIAVVSASPIVRESGLRQVKACGGEAVAVAELCDLPAGDFAVVLIDPGPTTAAPGVIAPPPPAYPAVVLLAPEQRDRIEGFRAAGYAGYLIKPLRRTSLADRVLAARAEGTRGRGPPVPMKPAREDERAAPGLVRGVRVLLAEDNPVNALLARALLARHGCSTDRVASGEEALAAMKAAPYDIVLMDMRMPGIDGLETTRRMRAQGDRTPIVALTANVFEDDRRACLEAGMNDFLTKPLDPSTLGATLARWTRAEPKARVRAG